MRVKIHADAHTTQHIRYCAVEEFTSIPGGIFDNLTWVLQASAP